MIRKDYWQEYKSLNMIEEEDPIMQLDPFGEKATDYITNSNAYLNFAVGSIRSGKTIAAIVTFLQHIKQSPHSLFAMAGKTLKSLERNVLTPMKGIMRYFQIKYYYHKKDNTLDIYNLGKQTKTIVLYGIEKKGSEELIKGSTYAGALLDEVTVMDPAGARMMISRNSLGDAKIFLTCNPDNPNNFVYQEYITNKELLNGDDVSVWNFLLDDNPSLSESYKKHIKSIYPPESVFYKRNILGQWASGQGLIYSRLDDNNFYDTLEPLDYYDYLGIGNDYGSGSTTCWNLVGVKEFSDHNEFDVIAEDGYNAKKEGHSLSDAEIVQRILMMQDKYDLGEGDVFYPSHDATSLKTALEDEPEFHMDIQTFKPNTMECIGEIHSLIYKNYLRIHTSCVETITCLRGYEWDVKASGDKPRKVDDHYADSIRAPIMNHLFSSTVIGFNMAV